ncbi:MAG: ABC transporter permease, partial [Varibaculum cambriense]|nr:ABC transporter permease [Varibaculum cambriense]
MSNQLLPGQKHFVNQVDETGLGAVDAVADESAPSSVWGEAWKQLRRRPLFWVALVIITLAVLMAVVPQLFTSQDPTYCTLENSLDGPTKGHVFGFDKQGCDLYSRIIYGARASIAVGIFSTLTATIIGVVFGALAGYFGGILDAILSRIVDIFFAIPMVLAAIVIMQMFKEHRSIWMVVIVLGVFGWTQIARITRGAVLSIKNEEYVTAARTLGVSNIRILLRH